jgi:mevalonate kinase
LKAVAEAPSKAIITGEHFVVHGAWALAAALPRTLRVEVRPASEFAVHSDRFPGNDYTGFGPIAKVVEAMGREFSVSPSVDVSITSSIPQGAGLGSSASTMVAVCSALSRLYSLSLGVDEVVNCAMVGERRIHGRPSGIDPAICAHGGVLLFRPGSRPRKVHLQGPRTLIVSYSGMKRSTKGQIGRVSLARNRHTAFFSILADSVSELSLSAAEKLQAGDMRGLGRLMTLNHAVLGTVGVTNETLDDMVDFIASHGAYGAKVTGAGGGGSVLAVAPKAKEKSIVSGLAARGFETFRAKIPAQGVKSWLER